MTPGHPARAPVVAALACVKRGLARARWSDWPLALAVFVAGTGVDYLSEGGLFFDEFFLWLVATCLLALSLLALGAVVGGCGLVAGHRGARRAGARMLAWAVGLVALLPLQACAGEALRFAILAPALSAQARDDAAPGEPGFALRMTWSGPGGVSGYLYDASREIERPDDRRSSAWHRRTARVTFIACVSASPLAGGYYRWWADDDCLAGS